MSSGLYGDALMDLARSGDGAGRLDGADGAAQADNPLCGDRARVEVRRDGDGRIVALGHEVKGCALCRAAAAALSRDGIGLDRAALADAAAALDATLDTGTPPPGAWASFTAFAAVHGHRSRYACVRLPFRAALAALDAQPSD